MNFIDRFRGLVTKGLLKAGQTLSFIPAWIKTSWMANSFGSLIQHGYKASSAVNACIRALAFSFPEPELIAYKIGPEGEQPVLSTDPLQQLLRRPNPDMGEAEFGQFGITYAAAGGNLYIWKERNASNRVVALWPFHDGVITPIPGQNVLEGMVKAYEYDPGDGHKMTIPKNDIIHWKWMVDPDQPWRGMGAIEAASRDIGSDTESTRYTYSLLKNDAIPRVAVTLVEGEQLEESRIKRLKKAWQQNYGGDNAGNVAFLESGMTIQRLGLDMQELDLSNLKNIPESRICASFGVPPVIALLYVGLKRSDYGDGQARRSFTETTLAALWRLYSSEMTNGLSDEFGGGYTLRFNLGTVRALQENLNDLWGRIERAINGGYLKRGEGRRALGYASGPEDDVYKVSLVNTWEAASGGKTLSAGETKTVTAGDTKAANAVYGRALQRIRKSITAGLSRDIDSYFSSLADRVVSRAEKALRVMAETKELPTVDELLTAKDESDLTKLLKRWFVSIVEASWETMNLSLGLTVAFDLTDPAVTAALATAGGDVKAITETTRAALQDVLKYGNEQGWSIGQLVRGDENQVGIRSIVEETYKNRSFTIARTELGDAQNAATAERYKENKIVLVGILDDGLDDDDDECKIANGQIWTLDYFEANRLEHPNCTRCSYPVFDDVIPDRS